jgi:hypothetical protein
MATDETEPYRRARVSELAAQQTDNRTELEARHGQVWSTAQLREQFEVTGYMAPYVIVRRKADDAIGSLEFQHDPRYYFNFQEDEPTR